MSVTDVFASPVFRTLTRLRSEERLVIVAGTGVSLAASQQPQATWSGLLRNGLEYLESAGTLASDVAELKPALDGDDVRKWLRLASLIKRDLEAIHMFTPWLEDLLGDLPILEKTLLSALAALDVPIITTNYDRILHSYLRPEHVITPEQRNLFREFCTRSGRRALLHLHGQVGQPTTIVFSSEDYDELYGRDHVETSLRILLASKTLLFVGCGQGVFDPGVGRLLDWYGRQDLDRQFPHYFLCTRSELRQAAAFGTRLAPALYGERHDELPEYVRRLAGPPAPRSSAGKNPLGPPPDEATSLTPVHGVAGIEPAVTSSDLADPGRIRLTLKSELGQIAFRDDQCFFIVPFLGRTAAATWQAALGGCRVVFDPEFPLQVETGQSWYGIVIHLHLNPSRSVVGTISGHIRAASGRVDRSVNTFFTPVESTKE
jgi:hypothetical protein